MTVYKIINPSDPYHLTADDLVLAAIAACLLGHGKYALEATDGSEGVPLFLFGGHDEWFAAQGAGSFDEALTAATGQRAEALAKVLESVSIVGTRSSLNDIGEAAARLAVGVRKMVAQADERTPYDAMGPVDAPNPAAARPTLADVQPGGRVRLEDQAERARFEAWVKNHVSSLARAADGEYASNFTHALWSAWQAALAAQPSPPSSLDLEAMLAACVPGGDIADPQVIADNIRHWFAAQPSPGGQDTLPAEAVWMLPDDARLVGVIADNIERGKLDHPGFYRNTQLAETLRRVLGAAQSGQRFPCGQLDDNDLLTALSGVENYLYYGDSNPIHTATVRAAINALAARQPVGDQCPDDLAVDAFAAAMKAKMAAARAKGRGGWEDPAQCSADDLSSMLRDHVEKGDPRDVANFCMMLHQRGEAIAARQPAGEPVGRVRTRVDGGFIAELLPGVADRVSNMAPLYLQSPAQAVDLERARDEGHDGAIRYVLGYLNGTGDCGSTAYDEILNACGRERIIRSAVEDGELEFTGLGRWVEMYGTAEDRALIDSQAVGNG